MSGGWAGSGRRARLPADWTKIRARILARDPTCTICGVRPSTHCDHIRPMTDDHRPAALQGVCGPCHDQKSAREGNAAKGSSRRLRPTEDHPGRR